MITLIRWIILQTKKVKLELAFYSFIEQMWKDFVEEPEKIKEMFVKEFAEIIDKQNNLTK